MVKSFEIHCDNWGEREIMHYIGLDAGSVSVKAVVLNHKGVKLEGLYRPHLGRPLKSALSLLNEITPPDKDVSLAVTGSAGRLIAEAMGLETVNEIVAQAYAVQKLHPHVRTVIEMGGEDSKLITLKGDGIGDFALNSVCAAGTGSFLDQQAERLGLTIEELGSMTLKCKKPPRVAGRCSVFAKSDMIHLQQIATPVEDIVAGLCFAVARNFKGSIVRGRKVKGPVAFQGGVAANPGMRRAFKEIFELDELFVPEDFALMGALGAALKQIDDNGYAPMDTDALEAYINKDHVSDEYHPPLRASGDSFHERHLRDQRDVLHPVNGGPPMPAWMGVDIGSISTNLAVTDSEGRLLAKRYLMTAGRPIEAVRRGLREIEEEVGAKVDIRGVGTTGSGRYMISDYIGADIVKNEITAQATAAAFIDPQVDTIFEIGGQDSKFISLREGVIVDFEMNKACAAGTGSFLEEQADKLSVSVKGEFAERACKAPCPSRLGERCTVFMENSLMSTLQKGASTDDLLAGLSYSIVQNYINRVVAGKPVGSHIFFQGGVAFNKSVVAAFEKHLGVEVTVPPNHDVTGAIGMALIARDHMESAGNGGTTFMGWGRSRTPYEISTFGCSSCSNMCEINRVKIEGEERKLFYGGRCEKYDINRKDTSSIPNLFKERDAMLWREVREPRGDRPLIGIPYIFYFNELLPYWARLMDELGFDVEVSPKPDRRIIDLGLQSIISEACYPVKVSLGHLRHLMERDVEAILCPSFVNLSPKNAGNGNKTALPCPHTQSIPYVGRVALEGIKLIAPVIHSGQSDRAQAREIAQAFKGFGISASQVRRAMPHAQKAQEEFYSSLKARGREVLADINEQTVVIAGRAYNSFERGMNLQIPEKLATLGVLAIPMDMLPLEGVDISEQWPNMYWRSGQRILKAARYISGHPYLYPIFIGYFSCGPDSFILKFFKKELGTKPFLHIEIDEHSADAGAITRCEAFLDSIQHRKEETSRLPKPWKRPTIKGRKFYIPYMSDHALAVAAAFNKTGIEAELLPESTHASVDLGMKYVSGKECYPCIVTTGDMVRKTVEPGFDPDRSAFFMPSGSGPCRFGQYNVFHSNVLANLGLGDVPVFAPNQDVELYRELKEVSKTFVLDIWRGAVAVGLMQKCLHERRPYELEPGSADALYRSSLDRVFASLQGLNGKMVDALAQVRRDFEALPVDRSNPRPLIGVIGEMFVRSNRFSNEDLVRKIEALGGEVWLSSMEEWLYYLNTIGRRRSLINRDWSAILDYLIKKTVKDRVEHGYARHFKGFLNTLHEPSIKEIFRKAAPYVDDSFEGEAVLSIGKAVDLAERGAAGIVNAMPFGCMPGTIVTALLRAVSRDHGVPCISVPYDGTESTTTRLQLEAFMDQARAKVGSIIRK